ncbi:ATP-binding protein [Paenibacillus donghaensis]|uniref:histidine kinase n=1 Tax=Paenibacillus donghaensis TaxID=414771 RepID=A0A2Z2KA80_9BACL|nr:hypothetical protein B9T62_02640 [Paenibacillus donghaensis]
MKKWRPVTDGGNQSWNRYLEESSSRIFEPFARNVQARQKEGAGLGLVIASQIAELHGGRLLLQQLPGKTTFILEIPEQRF